MPKVSIIIPVHNVEKFIKACVESAISQTLTDLEIICVDDASTDGSLEILEALAEHDSRVKIIKLAENFTANVARKRGVLESSGEIVMFLDGDDVLLPHASATVYRAMKERNIDVLHYGARIINCSGVEESRIKWNQNKIAPCKERIEGDLLLACFKDKRFFFTLWNKAFCGDLARRSFSAIENGRFPKAQDLYAVFVLLYYARSYVGISDVLMEYNFGRGITGAQQYELTTFARICQTVKVADAIYRFLERMQGLERYADLLKEIRENLLTDTLTQWIKHLKKEEMGMGFDMLIEHWPIAEVVSKLAENSVRQPAVYDPKTIAEAVFSSKARKINRPEKQLVVGVFYYRYHSGGVQRVISLLIPMFLKFGYKVVLITEESQPDGEYELPAEVVREIIPPFSVKSPPNYRDRAMAIAAIIKRHKIDVFNSHASSGLELLFDVLLVQGLGCHFLLSRHELAFASFVNGYELPIRQPATFRLVDRMTCLTRMDEQYYRLMGIPVDYIPNPPPRIRLTDERAGKIEPVIIWVGRLDYTFKQCHEPIEIMSEVVKSVPNAKLLMVGGGWSDNAGARLRERIRVLGLSANIELCGYTANPQFFYQKAVCHLMTSAAENYPMVIEEGRAYGLPLVLYELPYLELLRSGKGFLAVEQGDRKGAAAAITSLLVDSDLRERMSMEARKELSDSSSGSACELGWKHALAFRSPTEQPEFAYDERLLRLLLDTMLELYGRGVRKLKKEVNEEKAERNKLISQMKEHVRQNKITSESALVTPIDSTQQILFDLKKRKDRYGSIGALDFLINRYQRN